MNAPESSSSVVPADPRFSELVESMLVVVAEVLRSRHLINAGTIVEGPDLNGAFPGVWLTSAEGVPSVVPDANVLRNDILRTCRVGRTVLVTAANAGSLRLLCAQHVIDEVEEHSYEWAGETGVPQTTFINVWRRDYLPLLRLVPDADALELMLTDDERARVAALEDRDDQPSVVLALASGAYFLSEDGRALRAVYGAAIDIAEHRKWLEVLKAGGDAGELERLAYATHAAVIGLAACAYRGARATARATSLWLLPLVAALGLGTIRAPQQVRSRARVGLRTVAAAYLAATARYLEASRALSAASAPLPEWNDIIAAAGPRETLARACLRNLARSGQCTQSAEQLASQLPPLGVAQGPQHVGKVLCERACFVAVGSGRWQVGRQAEPHRP